jgi:hypothetical protein
MTVGGDGSVRQAPRVAVVAADSSTDRAWAKRLHNRLRRYRPPPDAHVVWTRCQPAIADITRNDSAEDCEYLVVVCSLRTPASAAVARLVDLFLERRTPDQVLPFMVEADPFATFPPRYLSRVTRKTIGRGGIERVVVDQLAASIVFYGPGSARRLFREEFLRLAAPILGCGFDELYDRERQRATRRRLRLFSLAAVALLLSFTGIWRISVEKAWVTTTLATFAKTKEIAAGFGKANPVRIVYRRLENGALLIHGFVQPGIARWDSQSLRTIWDLPFARDIGPRARQLLLATAEDQLTIVGVDEITGATTVTPFRLSEPNATFRGNLAADGTTLVAQPLPGGDELVLWSFVARRVVATIDHFMAPSGVPQMPNEPSAFPEDLFVRSAMSTKDLSRLVVPCRMRGTVVACLWDVTKRKMIAPLSTDFAYSFGGYNIDESHKIIVTTDYRANDGQIGFWNLDDGTLIRKASVTRSSALFGPKWPTILSGRHLLVPSGKANVLIDMVSVREPVLRQRTVLAGVRVIEGNMSTDAVAWQEGDTGTTVWDLDEKHAPRVLKTLGLGGIEFLMFFPKLECVVVGLPNTVEIWDSATGHRRASPFDRDIQTSVKPTLDGAGLVLHKLDGALRLVDLLGGDQVFVLPFIASSTSEVRWNRTDRVVDVYTDNGEVLRYRWQNVNRLSRFVSGLLPRGH